MASPAVIAYLSSQVELNQDLAERFVEFIDLYRKKLWHQLTTKLEAFITLPRFREGEELISLYNHFIKDFETKMNQLTLAKITVAVANQYKDHNQALEFLKGVAEKVRNQDSQAYVLVLSTMSLLHLYNNNLKDAKEVIETAQTILDGLTGVDQAVYASYYRVWMGYYKAKSQAGEFFTHSLQYLAYVSLDEMSQPAQAALAFDLCIAALIGESIYNFGELLSNPIINSLHDTPLAWMVDLITIFNVGDMAGYEALVATHREALSNQAALVNNYNLLIQKLSIIALMELVFKRPADSRTISFSDIAVATKLPITDVEHLVMKALSLELVRGVIDQVAETVSVTWVQPRVLDLTQIRGMKTRLESWTKKVQDTLLFIETETPELLV